MSCILNFRVNGKDYVIENVDNLESYDLKTVLQLINKHINDGNNRAVWEELKLVLSGRKFEQSSFKDTSGKVIANHTVGSILNKYPYLYEGIENDSDLSNIKVLLARDIKSLANKNLSFGTRLIQNGEETFIIKDDNKSLTAFVNYLKIKKLVNDDKYETSDEDLKILKKYSKFTSFGELLLDFISDNSKYNDDPTTYAYLDETYRRLSQLNSRARFKTESLTNLNAMFNFGKNEISIDMSSFVNILQQDETLSELPKLTIKEFYNYYNKSFEQIYNEDLSIADILSLSAEDIDEYIKSAKTGIDAIVNFLISKDRNFDYKLSKSNSKKLFFDYSNLTFAEKFEDMYFRTVTLLTPIQYYKSYGIFSDGQGHFFVSKLFIHSLISGVKMYNSIDEAKKQINLKFTKDKIGQESQLFRRVYEGTNEINYSDVGSIGRVLLAPSSLHEFILNPLEMKLVESGDIFQFFKTFIFNEKWATGINDDVDLINRMRLVLDDSQKIIMLFYLTNANNKDITAPKTKDLIISALDTIANLKYDYYQGFTKGSNEKKYQARIKKVLISNEESALSEANSFFYSKMNAFNLLQSRLAKYKIKLHPITSDILVDQFKNIIENVADRRGQIKAFVYNNEIYINVDTANLNDFAHEYYHILLGALRATNEEGYIKLMDKFLLLINSNNTISDRYTLIKNQYNNFSEIDQLEETLVDVLGEYVANGKTGNLKFDLDLSISKDVYDLFDSTSEESIFDGDSLNDFLVLDMTLEQLLNKLKVFSQGSLKSLEGLLPKNNESMIKLRKLTHYIERLIADGELIKRC